jgi:hypothetical protein
MRYILCTAALLGLSAWGSAVAATGTSVSTSASALGAAVPLPGTDLDGGAFSSSSAYASGGAGGTGDAAVDLGVIKVFASMFSGPGHSIGSGSASGSWAEDINLAATAYTGMQARVKVAVTVQGFIDPVGSGFGTVNFRFRAGTASDSFLGFWGAGADPDAPNGFPDEFSNAALNGPLYYSGLHELNVNFRVGTPFQVSASLSVNTAKTDCQSSVALCEQSAPGSVELQFGNSSYWAGVSEVSVRDAVSGQYLPADLALFSVTSASGADWKRSFVPPSPVPEPGTAWLLGGGLLLLAGRTRRG